MKITFPLTAILIFFPIASLPAETPIIEWQRQFGTSSLDNAFDVFTDDFANVFVVGSTYGNLETASNGSGDALIRKYDRNGNVVWTQQFGTNELDVIYGGSADSFGNVFVAGWTQGSLAAPIQGVDDAFVRKYDSAGNIQWTRHVSSTSRDYGFDIFVDGYGGAYVTGETWGNLGGANSGSSDAFLRRLDSVGSIAWSAQLGTSQSDRAQDAAVDSTGNVYIVGQTLGSFQGSSPSGSDAFVARYSSDGQLVWTRQMSTNEGDVGRSIVADATGHLYVTGYTVTTPNSPVPDQYDAFLRKYDIDGNLVWNRQFGTVLLDGGEDVAIDPQGNVYVVGSTEGDFARENRDRDVIVVKYDASGDLVWKTQLGSTERDTGWGIDVDTFGKIYVTGTTFGDLAGQSSGGQDFFLIKLANVPEPASLALLGCAAFNLICMRRQFHPRSACVLGKST